MSDWIVGQRCASMGELALGLGIVRRFGARNIVVEFPAVGAERTYAKEKAPLDRVTFSVGEVVRDNAGHSFVVKEVKEQGGLLFYLGETEILPESEMDHTTVYSRPDQKLLAGFINKPAAFELRQRAWQTKYQGLSSPVRGFLGARIELIPHQLYIASQVSGRKHPRVLLSDEVGLGKTIEAGLIFHRLMVTGEVKRVLCLVPEPLVTQWLTELYRKFNVLFNIMTPRHAEELAKTHESLNPYMCHQCVLQAQNAAVEDENLRTKIVEADWDLLIVDEAHHLLWTEQKVSPQYRLVEELSQVCGGMLLLTATPRQLGLQGHFGRLKLLDPERFDSFEKFQMESKHYTKLAELTDRVLAGKGKGISEEVAKLFPGDKALLDLAPDQNEFNREEGQAFIDALIDRHGTGRMVYRNHRKVLEGFPKRVIQPVPLTSNPSYDRFIQKGLEVLTDTEVGQRLLAGAPAFQTLHLEGKSQENKKILDRAWREDPRVQWLVPFLRERADEKFLLICSRKSVVLALQEWLGLTKDIEVAVFHEELSLVERDRQAAYFSKTNGATVLLCSEIGSEGRNFQFAHNLILFDLPLNPALLEQRIGRLDRIGQHHDIEITIPFPKKSPLECLFNWYQRGLDAFENHLIEGDYIYEHLKEKIFTVFEAVDDPQDIETFIQETLQFTQALKKTIKKGRDRLLELNSFKREPALALIEEIEAVEDRSELKAFMDDVFEIFRVAVEDQDQLATQIILPTPQMKVSSFPGLPEEGLEITYDREKATAREELTFISHDHPMVEGTIDLLLSMDRGVTSFAVWKQAPEPGTLLECHFILESAGAEEAKLARFLPPTPITIAVDQNRQVRDDLLENLGSVSLDLGPKQMLFKKREALTQIVETLLKVAEAEAFDRGDRILESAEKATMNAAKVEYDRLKALMAVNPSVREDELDYIEEGLHISLDYLENSKVRLDAVRMILMVP